MRNSSSVYGSPTHFAIIRRHVGGTASANVTRFDGPTMSTAAAQYSGSRLTHESVANPRAIGAGITLQPTGQAALARLGLLDAVEARGARIDRLVCVRKGGKYLVDLPYSIIDPRLYGLGIHRGVLFEVLFAAASAAGAKITCGAKIKL